MQRKIKLCAFSRFAPIAIEALEIGFVFFSLANYYKISVIDSMIVRTVFWV